jgi:hypothetical protein
MSNVVSPELSMNAHRSLWLITAVLGASLAGCPRSANSPSDSSAPPQSRDASAPSNSNGSSAAQDAAVDAGLLDAADDVSEDDDAVVYCPDGAIDSTTLVIGWSAKGKTVTAKLVSATPNPPERYNNEWLVDFVDTDGKAIEDLKVTGVQTWMPYHSHGKPGSATQMSPGHFKLALNFQMRGYFQVKLDVKSAQLGSDHIDYYYCLR